MIFKRKRSLYFIAPAVALIALVYFAHPFFLETLGSYFVVEEPLEPASAIVVLSGEVPFRAMEAAGLYREKWAPKVVLTRGVRREEDSALEALGLTLQGQDVLNREILLRSGVPAAAIVILPRRVDNTLDELKTVTHDLALPEGAALIIVTSKAHTKRTAKIWNYVTQGKSKAIIRWARGDPFDVHRWWKERRFSLEVARESLGLLNYCLGFPMG